MIRVTAYPDSAPEALDMAATMSRLRAPDSAASRVELLVQDATALAERIACRKLWFRGYEQIAAGCGDRLYLDARPIASVSSIAPATGGSPLDPSGFEVWPEDGALFRPGSGWGRLDWRVAYFGGYWLPSMQGDVPDGAAALGERAPHIAKAVEDIVAASWDSDRLDRSVRSESMGGKTAISTTYNTDLTVPADALAVLKRLAPIVP